MSKGEDGRGLYEENIVLKARLILHFDINKTLLMSDKAQGANTDHIVNVLLSECVWGRLEPGPKWVPVGRLATDRYLHPLFPGMDFHNLQQPKMIAAHENALPHTSVEFEWLNPSVAYAWGHAPLMETPVLLLNLYRALMADVLYAPLMYYLVCVKSLAGPWHDLMSARPDCSQVCSLAVHEFDVLWAGHPTTRS